MLDKEDVERIVSEALGREVKLSEMEVQFIDYQEIEEPENEDAYPCGLDCIISVDGEEVEDDEGMPILNEYLTDISFLNIKYYFNFDTDEFGSFERTYQGI